MGTRINSFEIENIKRVKAVALDCSGQSLTVIGGRNGQGKTSILDAICWTLGGDRFKPSEPFRKDSVIPGKTRIVLNNGMIVERKGKNGTLSVTDPEERSGGQTLLNKFISQFALNLPKFLNGNDSEKAKPLLQIIGIGEELTKLDLAEKKLFEQRQDHGRYKNSRQKYANELPYYEGSPTEPVSVSQLIQEQQAILAQNGENQRKRQQVTILESSYQTAESTVKRLREQLHEAEQKLSSIAGELTAARRTAKDIQDQSTAEIEASIRNIEEINEKVRANEAKLKAVEEAETLQETYDDYTKQIEEVRKAKINLLNGAPLPLPGLAVDNGELIYNGQKWDCMSGSDQLKVATAIIQKLNPECGFVLVDKLEQFDVQTLQEFGQWCESVDLQVIGTRVSTGDECSIVIEDGLAVEQEQTPAFTEGDF